MGTIQRQLKFIRRRIVSGTYDDGFLVVDFAIGIPACINWRWFWCHMCFKLMWVRFMVAKIVLLLSLLITIAMFLVFLGIGIKKIAIFLVLLGIGIRKIAIFLVFLAV